MGNPLVSVIIPVYNVEPYLKECVASVRAQTYANLQIILVDDGSTDGSGQMCDALAEEDTRIEVIHKENGGLSSARNAGLKVSRGVYIYFVDSDDWVETALVEKTLIPMERDGYDQCIWGMYLVEEGKRNFYSGRWKPLSLHFSTLEEKRRVLCRWFLPSHLGYTVWSRVYRRDLIEQNGLRFQNEREISAEDVDFNVRYLAVCRSLYYVPEGLYYYRQRSGSIIQSGSQETRMARELRMIRRQDETLSHQELFQAFYIYGGVTLVRNVADYTRGGSVKQGIAKARAIFQNTEDWEYLLAQARLARRDRRRILRECGWSLGGWVCTFYRYILDGDSGPFCLSIQMERLYSRLRYIRFRLLCRL